MMTRDQHLTNAAEALRPVRDLLQKDRAGVSVTFNPLMVQIALEYAKVHALLAMAALGTPLSAEVLDSVVASEPLAVPPPAPAPPGNGGGLILPT